MRLALLAVVLVAAPSVARADAALQAGVLPTVSPRAAELRRVVTEVARTIAPAAGAAATFTLGPAVARADALSASGHLDEAAALFDVAIDEGTRAPLSVADPAALLHAHLARATIGLARGEEARAEALLGRVLRWDPTYRPAASELTPRVQAALARVAARLGPRPALEPGDVGEACAGERLVGRVLGDGDEVARVAGCRVVATTMVRGTTAPAAVAAVLGWVAPSPRRERPVYRRGWFWAVLAGAAAVAAGAGVGIWAATRSDDWHVTPHL